MVINKINGMKYIGARTCYCRIKDDPYLGSGAALKLALEIYGESNFEKQILCVCKSEREKWRKERQFIRTYNAVDSMEYYNITPGGSSKPGIYVMSVNERNKFNKLKEQMKMYQMKGEDKDMISRMFYGVKPNNKKDKQSNSIVFATARIIGNTAYVRYQTTYDDSNREDKMGPVKKENPRIIGLTGCNCKIHKMNSTKGINENFLLKQGYMIITKDEYLEYWDRVTWNDLFAEVYNEIFERQKNYFKQTNKSDTNKSNKTETTSVSKTDVKKKSSKGMNKKYIEEYAKEDHDYQRFLNIMNRYPELNMIIPYQAVTGLYSVSGDSIRDREFRCSETQAKNARMILDYESKFTPMIKTIGGNTNFYHMAIGFCYGCKDVNNEELFKRFSRKYSELPKVYTMIEAINKIDNLYNFRNSNKVDIVKAFKDKVKK